MEPDEDLRSPARRRADGLRAFRCRHLVAVLEEPSDVKNVGTVIRNVNALGVEKVYVVDRRGVLPTDWSHLRTHVILNKTSASAAKWTFVKTFSSTDACFDHLERHRFTSYVTSPHVKGKRNLLLHEGDYATPHKLAIWFGNESHGISPRAVERCEACIRIPMFGMIESLNLGTSSGIVLYEVTKQRRAYQSLYRWRDRRGRREVPSPTEPHA